MKLLRRTASILIITCLLSFFHVYADTSGNRGDIDSDGNIGQGDAIPALLVLKGMSPAYVNHYADVNGDGRTGPEEIIYALQISPGKSGRTGFKKRSVSNNINIKTDATDSAYEIFLEAVTEEGSVETVFPPGSDLYLNINLVTNWGGGVAGCAFTLLYPADKLTIDSPSSFTCSGYSCVNSSEPGKILFAGAEIDENGSGNFYNATLFSVKFTVKDKDHTSGIISSDDINFELVQTHLNNPDAGWNGEGVPILAGAFHLGITQDEATQLYGNDVLWIDGFDGDLRDDFPILLENFAENPRLPSYTKKGDVARNGGFGLEDAIIALKIMTGIKNARLFRSDYAASGADVDGDNKVGLEEVLYILRKINSKSQITNYK
ncbi:MAG: hypothetical protein GY795_36470 [Desulfobacterales bacterium]|nr:hypothetical protein [Desulfobacterales bacterium]